MPYYEGVQPLTHWRSSPAPVVAGPTTAHGSLMIAPMDVGGDPFPGLLYASSFALAVSGNLTATSVSQSLSSLRLGLYTRNGSTLGLVNSASVTFGNPTANNSNTSRWNGVRVLTLATSDWSSAPIFEQGMRYYVAVALYSAVTTGAMSFMNAASVQTVYSGIQGGASNATHHPFSPFRGRYTASTTAMPATIQASQVSGSGTLGSFTPWIRLDQDFANY